ARREQDNPRSTPRVETSDQRRHVPPAHQRRRTPRRIAGPGRAPRERLIASAAGSHPEHRLFGQATAPDPTRRYDNNQRALTASRARTTTRQQQPLDSKRDRYIALRSGTMRFPRCHVAVISWLVRRLRLCRRSGRKGNVDASSTDRGPRSLPRARGVEHTGPCELWGGRGVGGHDLNGFNDLDDFDALHRPPHHNRGLPIATPTPPP